MSKYRIVCVKTEHPHRHIVSVGVGDNPRVPAARYTVATVRSMIDKGDAFYTESPSTRKTANVKKDTCGKGSPACPVLTIRSHADAVTDNNLDNLSTCP
jgi:hypothetical protein